MVARIQQVLGLFLCALVLAWGAGCLLAEQMRWALLGMPALLFAYAASLAVGFLFMRQVNRSHGVKLGWGPLLSAWWGETRCALRIFAWQQPWRSRRFADRFGPAREGIRGVLFVHGYLCNRGFWNSWMERLEREGVPFMAINLEPVFGSIDDYLPAVESAVAQLVARTGRAPIIVAHSMGGLVTRRWLSQAACGRPVHHVITLGSPHHGTWLARFAMSRNARQMRPGSRWLRSLVEHEAQAIPPPFTCFYSTLDNIVFPALTATLPGADNRPLHGAAHVDMVLRDEPWQELRGLVGLTVADAAPSSARRHLDPADPGAVSAGDNLDR